MRKNFTMIPNDIQFSPDFTGLPPGARILYSALKSYSYDDSPVFPAHATLAANIGKSISSIRRGIKALSNAGFIHISPPDKNRATNLYYFPREIAEHKKIADSDIANKIPDSGVKYLPQKAAYNPPKLDKIKKRPKKHKYTLESDSEIEIAGIITNEGHYLPIVSSGKGILKIEGGGCSKMTGGGGQK